MKTHHEADQITADVEHLHFRLKAAHYTLSLWLHATIQCPTYSMVLLSHYLCMVSNFHKVTSVT